MGKLTAIVATVLTVAAVLAPAATARASSHRHHTPRDTAAVQCDLFASPSGSDSAGDGSLGSPFASLNRLDAVLRPGQTGCLRAGSYGGTSTWHQLDTDGTARGQITIASYPGESATVRGYVDIEGSYTTLSHLSIDGSNTFYKQVRDGTNCPAPVSQPLMIAGQNDVLEYDNYYQGVARLRGNGIGIGFWGNADNAIIRYSKIHDVGQCEAYDHLIYLSHGNNVQIYDNWIYDDAHGRGVQLYPAPTNARVYDNVIDHVGEGFVIGNEPGYTVSGNQIFENTITNCMGLPSENIMGQGIHDIYGGRPGTGNTFHDNVLFKDPGGLGDLSAVRAYANATRDPGFINQARHDYETRRGGQLAPGPH
jgi:hypothetical protein